MHLSFDKYELNTVYLHQQANKKTKHMETKVKTNGANKTITLRCGLVKESEKAYYLCFADKGGIHWIWCAKSISNIEYLSDDEQSYGYGQSGGKFCKISVPVWFLKKMDEVGIKEYKDKDGDVYSV